MGAELICVIDLDADRDGASLCGRKVGEIKLEFHATTKKLTTSVVPIVPVIEGIDAWWVNRALWTDQVCHECLATLSLAADPTAPAQSEASAAG